MRIMRKYLVILLLLCAQIGYAKSILFVCHSAGDARALLQVFYAITLTDAKRDIPMIVAVTGEAAEREANKFYDFTNVKFLLLKEYYDQKSLDKNQLTQVTDRINKEFDQEVGVVLAGTASDPANEISYELCAHYAEHQVPCGVYNDYLFYDHKFDSSFYHSKYLTAANIDVFLSLPQAKKYLDKGIRADIAGHVGLDAAETFINTIKKNPEKNFAEYRKELRHNLGVEPEQKMLLMVAAKGNTEEEINNELLLLNSLIASTNNYKNLQLRILLHPAITDGYKEKILSLTQNKNNVSVLNVTPPAKPQLDVSTLEHETLSIALSADAIFTQSSTLGSVAAFAGIPVVFFQREAKSMFAPGILLTSTDAVVQYVKNQVMVQKAREPMIDRERIGLPTEEFAIVLSNFVLSKVQVNINKNKVATYEPHVFA